MGCLKSRDADMEFHEVIVSDGVPRRIDFKGRNRRVVRAWTTDRELTLTRTDDAVYIHGPRGAEVIVVFTIG